MPMEGVRSRVFTPLIVSERRRDPVEEREEISRYLAEGGPDRPPVGFKESIGRIPEGPARGWRLRAKKAKSCDICEGDLWVELKGGSVVPCGCKKQRAAKRAHYRLRAGNWWQGTSLSLAAPPLAHVPNEIQVAVEALCADVKAGKDAAGLWLVGGAGSGKSAISAYIAQQLYPVNRAIAGQVGDLVSHLRWLGAVKGEGAVERRVQMLAETPLLVLDNVDRAVRSRPPETPFALDASCLSQDLIRLGRLLQERHAAMKPTVMTSRAEPSECHLQLTSITRADLVRGLLGTAVGASDPFEDFPAYTLSVLQGAMENVRRDGFLYSLDSGLSLAQAA